MYETCERANKLWRHCDWEAVYDIVKPHEELARSAFFSSAEELGAELIEALVIRETYVGSLCKTCGKYIPRGDNTPAEQTTSEQHSD